MSNKNIKKRLEKLFTNHSVKEIEAHSGARLKKAVRVERYSELAEDEDFKNYYEMLKVLRKDLDDALIEKEHIEQAKGCLRLLKEIKDYPSDERIELLSRLISGSVYKKWGQEEQEYYNTGRQMLTEWRDFFLSYTNRGLPETNNDFKKILPLVFGEDYFAENVEKVNLVAGLIFRYLVKQNNLTAFFDKENMKFGDEIKEGIEKYCRSSYAFVQLVEPEIFQDEKKDQKNWCFHEFKVFAEWSGGNQLKPHKRFYFILTIKDEVFPANFPGYYKKWQDKISGHLHIEGLSSLNKEEIRHKCKEIANEIVDTRNKIQDDYVE